MSVIFKYKINDFNGAKTRISLPKKSKILDIQEQNNEIFLWALNEPENDLEERTFVTIGTEHSFDSKTLEYVKTVQSDIYVWHIFEEKLI